MGQKRRFCSRPTTPVFPYKQTFSGRFGVSGRAVATHQVFLNPESNQHVIPSVVRFRS